MTEPVGNAVPLLGVHVIDGRERPTASLAMTPASMSLRDWFAGQALAGLMSNENTPFSADYAEIMPSQIAEAVFDIADAMLAERSKP